MVSNGSSDLGFDAVAPPLPLVLLHPSLTNMGHRRYKYTDLMADWKARLGGSVRGPASVVDDVSVVIP